MKKLCVNYAELKKTKNLLKNEKTSSNLKSRSKKNKSKKSDFQIKKIMVKNQKSASLDETIDTIMKNMTLTAKKKKVKTAENPNQSSNHHHRTQKFQKRPNAFLKMKKVNTTQTDFLGQSTALERISLTTVENPEANLK